MDKDHQSRLEAMLIAHRKIIADIIAQMPSDGADAILANLDRRETFQDGQEDPGAVPAEGVGSGLAISEETARIVSLVRAKLQTPD